jgi:hypothetical protein
MRASPDRVDAGSGLDGDEVVVLAGACSPPSKSSDPVVRAPMEQVRTLGGYGKVFDVGSLLRCPLHKFIDGRYTGPASQIRVEHETGSV